MHLDWEEYYALALAHFREHWALDVAAHTPLYAWLSLQRHRADFSIEERLKLDAINFFEYQRSKVKTDYLTSLDPFITWTTAEDQYLIEQVDLPLEHQAAHLGRTIDEVGGRRQYLGLIRRQRAVQRMAE
jgi:hypothetical protein